MTSWTAGSSMTLNGRGVKQLFLQIQIAFEAAKRCFANAARLAKARDHGALGIDGAAADGLLDMQVTMMLIDFAAGVNRLLGLHPGKMFGQKPFPNCLRGVAGLAFGTDDAQGF